MNVRKHPNMNWVISFAIVLFIIPAYAAAQQGYPVEAGRAGADIEIFPNINNNDFVLMRGLAGRSYCCKVRSQSFSDEIYFDDVTKLGAAVNFEARGDESPLYAHAEDHASPSRTRLCFVAPEDAHYGMTFMIYSGSATNVRAECTETTLFGTFNTILNEFNFLELSNTLRDAEVTGTWTAIDTVNNNTVVDAVPFSIPSGGRIDLSIHDAPGGASVFGNIIINHDGSPGSVRAFVSQYKVTSASPLQFELVAREELKTR